MSPRADAKLIVLYYFKLAVIALCTPLALVLVVARYILDIVWPLNQEKDVRGQVALITGSGQGLGREIAIRLAKKGCQIAVVDIDFESAKETVKIVECEGVKAKAYKVDVSNYEQVATLAKDVERDLGVVEILVNNAGLMPTKRVSDLTKDDVERTIGVNLTSNIWTVMQFLDKMKEKNSGHIVTTNSIAGICPVARGSIYCTTKFAVVGFMNALRVELMTSGHEAIEVTTIQPYFIRTNKVLADFLDRNKVLKHYPMLSAKDVAERTVKAILTNERQVLIPGSFAFPVWVLRQLPTVWQDYVLTFFTDSDVMNAE